MPGVQYELLDGITPRDPLEISAVEPYLNETGNLTWKRVLCAP